MYCEVTDLLVGDMPLNATMANGFIQAAQDEIDSSLGMTYTLPLDLAAADPTVELYLKRTCALLASGRLILAQATAAEDEGVHAYGMYLLSEGKQLVAAVASGDMELMGVTKRAEYASEGNGPSIIQEDTYSPVDTFYAFASRGETSAYFRPGDVA